MPAHILHMSTFTAPMPTGIVARTSESIRSLNDEQLGAVITASRKVQKRVLPQCWATVSKVAPDLASALDDLHARGITEDLPRFQALAAEHERQLNAAVKGRTGKLTAMLVFAAAVLGLTTVALGVTGAITLPLILTGTALTAVLFGGAYTAGGRLARQSTLWMFADPEAAAATVWDAGIDAAAAAALAGSAGQDGLTPDVLQALSGVWTGAGLAAEQLAVRG